MTRTADPGDQQWVLTLEEVGRDDVGRVGGKNASLGEMIGALAERGLRVPRGFATTADAYSRFLEHNELHDEVAGLLDELHADGDGLAEVGRAVRSAILAGEMPPEVAQAVRGAYRDLAERLEREDLDVAVRSSATAEDLPEASFAGQQETFLNVVGEEDLLEAVRGCFASLFTDRAITYRENQGFDHMAVALSVGVQEMVRSDLAGAGVLFTLDPDSGFRDVVLIDANRGLGETVVQGTADPDAYVVFKPLLESPGRRPILERQRGAKEQKLVYAAEGEGRTTLVDTSDEERSSLVLDDDEILTLARWAVIIEQHDGVPMDVEWAKDGRTGELVIVQARPETVASRRSAGSFRRWHVGSTGERLLEGLAIGQAVGAGPVCRILDAAEIDRFEDGSVLVTDETDPDWVPIMKRAAAIVTDHGGRTSHAAIVSRELGLPAVVGTGRATEVLEDGRPVTVSCAEGSTGVVTDGEAEISSEEIRLDEVPETRTGVMINLASPSAAFRWAFLPADGVGLARIEFIITNAIRVHPMALVHFDELEDEAARDRIGELTAGHDDKPAWFVERLAAGIARLGACQHPRPVLVRFSDFKTNEYAQLVGGRAFEPTEANPMLGFRGAARYHDPRYREGFRLECRAVRRAREEVGLTNIAVMVPFCRTPEEADRVLQAMAEEGLVRGREGLDVYVMCEVPSNVLRAEEFADRFDGFSIGSNDLTQLVLGVDRDSELLAGLFDESDPAVVGAIRDVIRRAHARGTKVGLCGQRPSDDVGFTRMLVEAGIDSVSVTPDAFLEARRTVAAAEGALRTAGGGEA